MAVALVVPKNVLAKVSVVSTVNAGCAVVTVYSCNPANNGLVAVLFISPVLTQNSFLCVEYVAATSLVYVVSVSIVISISLTLLSILYSPCGVCKNESLSIVPPTLILAVANGVPVEAVAVLVVPVPVVVIVHVHGLTLFTFTNRLVTLVALLTAVHKSKARIPPSIVVFHIGSVLRYVQYITVLLLQVIVSTSSADVTGILLSVLIGWALFVPVPVIEVSSGNISTPLHPTGAVCIEYSLTIFTYTLPVEASLSITLPTLVS